MMITFISLLCIALVLLCIYYRVICVKQNRVIDGYAKKLARCEGSKIKLDWAVKKECQIAFDLDRIAEELNTMSLVLRDDENRGILRSVDNSFCDEA